MRIRFLNRLVLCAVGVGLLFSSCKKDDDEAVVGEAALSVANTTWGINSSQDVTAGITLKFAEKTFTYTAVNIDGRAEIVRGTFATVPPYDVVLRQEDGTPFARAIEKEGTIEVELFDLSGMVSTTQPNFQNHAYMATPTSSANNSKYLTLISGIQGMYVATPGSVAITIANDTLGENGAGQSWAEVTLSWAAVAGATHYKIFRNTNSGTYELPYFAGFRTTAGTPSGSGNLTLTTHYAEAAGTATSIVFPRESATTEYQYYVAAYNNNTPLGAPGYAYKPDNKAVAAPVGLDYFMKDNNIILSWEKDYQKSSYRIYQKAKNGNRIVIANITANTDFSARREMYSVSTDALIGGGFISGETYDFTITGFSSTGVESPVADFATITYYDQVTNFAVAFDEDGMKMLTWDKVLDASSYNVYSITNYDTIVMATTNNTVDNEVAVSALTNVKDDRSYDLTVSAHRQGQFSTILQNVDHFPAPTSFTTSIYGVGNVDSVVMTWPEIRTLETEADSYVISYVYVDTTQQISDLDEFGKIIYDFRTIPSTQQITISKDMAVGNDALWYDKGNNNSFEFRMQLPNNLYYRTYQFYIQAQKNGVLSDAVKAGTIIVQPQ